MLLFRSGPSRLCGPLRNSSKYTPICYPVLGAQQRMWALKKLRQLMMTHFGSNINVSMLIASPTTDMPDDPKDFNMVRVTVTISTALVVRLHIS